GGAEDGIPWTHPLVPFGLQGEVDHHDRVLLDDADQQNDADDGDQSQVVTGQQQGEQGADRRRRQRREDGDRVDIALVEYAEHDVHGHHGGENQQQRARQRSAKRLGGALEVTLYAGRQADLRFDTLDHL